MVVLIAEQIGSAEDQIEWTGQMVNMGSTIMRVAAMSQIFLQAERQKTEDGAPLLPTKTRRLTSSALLRSSRQQCPKPEKPKA